MNAVISYSHNDNKYLEDLHKHLAVLKREGSLNAWSDHDILAGDDFELKIKSNLQNSQLFLALVSPDYLASSNCYEKEFEMALQMNEQNRIRIIPIIVEPCDWQSTPFGKFLALPKDGEPISNWTNKNNAYLNIVNELRRILQVIDNPHTFDKNGTNTKSVSGRRVRLKHDYDAIDKAEFADKAFEIIRTYFEKSCVELIDADEDIKAKFEPMSNIAFSCTVINRAKRNNGEAHITIYSNNSKKGIGDISYVWERRADNNSSNGNINVEADEYDLYLSYNSYSAYNENGKIKYTAEQIAEILWNEFVTKAGVKYE